MNGWVLLWTVLWFGGLALFTLLAVLVTVNGGKDMVALLRTLNGRHAGQPAETPAE